VCLVSLSLLRLKLFFIYPTAVDNTISYLPQLSIVLDVLVTMGANPDNNIMSVAAAGL